MPNELIYTSAPRGLRSGSQGFCTVAMTAQMPQALASRLEALSGYKPIYPPGQAGSDLNPPCYAHWRLEVGGQLFSILSRVALAGLDYTHRPSKLAHHIALDAAEQPAAGPAWVMRQPGVMQTQWNDQPHYLPQEQRIPAGPNPPRICAAWEAACGDAGWAGVLAQAFVNDPNRPAYLLYEPPLDVLVLIDEALALLSPALRWQVTFNTHFTELPAHLSCAWRCCALAAPQSPRSPDALVIDLTHPLGRPPSSPYVQSARTGQAAAEFASAEPTPIIEAALPEISAQAPPYGDEPQHDYPAFPRQPVSAHRRPRQPAWTGAVVWPAIVLGIIALICIGFWINQKLHPPLESALPELTALRNRVNQLTNQITAALNKEMDLANQLQAEKNRQLQSSGASPSSDADEQKIQDLLDQLRQRDEQIADLRARLVAANAALPAKPAPAATQTQIALHLRDRATATFPIIPADPAAPSAQRLILDANSAKWNGKTPIAVSLLLPGQRADLEPSPTVDGCLLSLKGKNNVGGDKNDELLEIKFQDGDLWWTWRQYPRLAQTDKARMQIIEKMLRYAAVQVVDANNIWTVQFHPIAQRVLHLGQTDPQLEDMAKELHAKMAWGPVLAVERLPSGWTATSDEQQRRLTFHGGKLAEATFVVELNAADGTLSSDWLLLLDQFQRQQKQTRQDRESLQSLLPQRSDADIAKLDPAVRKPYELIRQHSQDEIRLGQVVQRLNDVGKVTLEILLPRSQVVLEQVEVVK